MHSFKFETRGGFGRIQHFLEAVVVDNNEVQAQKSIVWVNKFPKPGNVIMPVSSEASIKVNSCCCLKSGRTELKSTINHNVAMVTEDLSITSKIVNTQDSYTVTKITCDLIRSMRLKVKNSYCSHSLFFSHVILTNSQYLAIKPGQSVVSEIVTRLGLKDSKDLWMLPNVESELVDCEYTIKVMLEFDNFCGCGTYAIMLPLEICNGMMVLDYRLSAPPQINIAWNPVMLSPVPIQAQGSGNIPDQDHNIIIQEITTVDADSAREPLQFDTKV